MFVADSPFKKKRNQAVICFSYIVLSLKNELFNEAIIGHLPEKFHYFVLVYKINREMYENV
jgi:hypothetical protein